MTEEITVRLSDVGELLEDARCVEEFARNVTAWENGEEDGDAVAIEAAERLTAAFEAALASQPEHSEEAGEQPAGQEVGARVIEAIDALLDHLTESGLVEEGGGLPLAEKIKPLADARAALAALSACKRCGGSRTIPDTHPGGIGVYPCRDCQPSRPAPSPEPGSDAEVAERLRALAKEIHPPGSTRFQSDIDAANGLRLAADRLLARPVLSEEERERLEEIARRIDAYSESSRAGDDADFLRSLTNPSGLPCGEGPGEETP